MSWVCEDNREILRKEEERDGGLLGYGGFGEVDKKDGTRGKGRDLW